MLVGRHPWFSYMGFEGDPSPPGDPGSGQSGAGGGQNPPPKADPPTPTLTQAQFDSALTSRLQAAEVAAQRKLLESLGIENADEAKRLIAAQKAADDAQKTEAQRAREAADREKAEAETAKAEALRTTRRANVTLAVANAGVRGDRVAAATTLLLAELPADADEAAIKDAAEGYKEKYPEFFGAVGEGKPPAVNPGGGPRANGSQGGQSGIEAGRARAKAELEAARNRANPFEGMPMIGGIR